MAPLLAGLNTRQIDALERTFRKQASEDAEENAPENAAQRERKSAKRYKKS
ncbi:MAG: hypothetical protein WBM40_15365 [Thiohalocapsa sp.]